MTTKHYTAFAVILKCEVSSKVERSRVAEGMAPIFKRDNRRFDRDRFFEACGL